MRYPSSWQTEQVQQAGIWYRYFLSPPAGPERKPGLSVTLLAGPLTGTLEEHAQGYLTGNPVSSTRDEKRQGATGRAYRFASADGRMRYSLLLLQEEKRVYGLYTQGEAPHFQAQLPLLEEMEKSLTLERPQLYPEHRNEKYGFALRVPESWRSTRSFSGGGSYLMQFSSPALGVERDQTLHASLTLSVEPVGADGTLESFYQAARDKLGEAFQRLNHATWRDGYVDVLRSETPVTVSRAKRFYRAADGRGYTLSFEARDDIYPRASRWCDIIAATLRIGSELNQQ